MEEKVLIKSERYNIKAAVAVLLVVGVLLSAILFYVAVSSRVEDSLARYDRYYDSYSEHIRFRECDEYLCTYCQFVKHNPSRTQYAVDSVRNCDDWWPAVIIFGATVLVGGLFFFLFSKSEMTVTDKRVYGVVAWGKRVDLPVDSISAIATTMIFSGVSVSTSSGRISFRMMKNSKDIYRVINNLIIARQQDEKNHKGKVAPMGVLVDDATEQVKKYKELLDMGAITEEEYQIKKKQLLNL